MFQNGLARLGYTITKDWQRNPRRNDVIVMWNRSRAFEALARVYENSGATVIIAENSYLPMNGGKAFALALNFHNGAGKWHPGDKPRFEIEKRPWRSDGDKVLVLPQRGIGSPGVAMPFNWPGVIKPRLEGITARPIHVRRHPGISKRGPSLESDLANTWCVVTWGSGAAIKALVAGIPVFHDFPQWIGGDGSAKLDGADIEAPQMEGRDRMLSKLSWAQWLPEEILSGEAFAHLLRNRP
jgi:hypothetical protein